MNSRVLICIWHRMLPVIQQALILHATVDIVCHEEVSIVVVGLFSCIDL